MTEYFVRRANAMDAANDTFSKLKDVIDAEVQKGAKILEVAEVARAAGLNITEHDLGALGVTPVVDVLTFLPWYAWFPWSPLWEYYWGQALPASPAAKASADRKLASAGKTLTTSAGMIMA